MEGERGGEGVEEEEKGEIAMVMMKTDIGRTKIDKAA